MEINREEFINSRVAEHYKEASSLGMELVGVWLQGSQNYNADCYNDSYKSDVDTKAIILPSIDDIVDGKAPYSHTHIMSNGEHIDVKDIREMFQMFLKQNNSFIEILFTKYFVVNPKYADLVQELVSHNEAIARYNTNQTLRCFVGTSKEKIKTLNASTANNYLSKLGYDPKSLYQIMRVNETMRKYIKGLPYAQCLISDDPQKLIDVKCGNTFSKDRGYSAFIEAKNLDDDNKKMMDTNLETPEPVHHDVEVFLDDLKKRFIKRFLIEELGKEKII